MSAKFDEHKEPAPPAKAAAVEPNKYLTKEEVVSPPLVEPPNPNDAQARNPGDPTISLNPDGTVANMPAKYSMTVTPNPGPSTQTDPAFAVSPLQPPPPAPDERGEALKHEAPKHEPPKVRPFEKDEPNPVPPPPAAVRKH